MKRRKRCDLSGPRAMRHHHDPAFYPLSCLSSQAPRDITLHIQFMVSMSSVLHSNGCHAVDGGASVCHAKP